ncbi:MAG: hypothetical protein QHH24_00680 [Candidatus Bathyarchaeota archaeon]|nr:hypothetical protein [Candidatus Bathyarchaeota archaeon]
MPVMCDATWQAAYYHGGITGGRCLMVDLLLITIGVLFGMAAIITAGILRKLKQAGEEYRKAKSAFSDIILSFDKQLERESKRLELVAYKLEASSSRNSMISAKISQIENDLTNLKSKIDEFLANKEQSVMSLRDLDKQVRDIIASQESLSTKVADIESKASQLAQIPEPKIDAVIPIRRDRALSPLTGTELAALEYLASEGPKTAPEIRWKIRLSREHTARLMKKLYEAGYLERDQSKIPFKYSAKKELEKVLKKTGDNAPVTSNGQS